MLMGSAAALALPFVPHVPAPETGFIDPTIYRLSNGPLRAGDIGIGKTFLVVFDGIHWRTVE